jgi:hypothetical protein
MDLDTKCFDVVGAVRTAGEVTKVELDLVPALIKAHRHRADERLHSRRALCNRQRSSETNLQNGATAKQSWVIPLADC